MKRNAKSWVVGIVLLTCLLASAGETPEVARTGALTFSRRAPLNDIPWKAVHAFDFENPAQTNTFRLVSGAWEIEDGRLWAVGGDEERAILLCPSDLEPVRITFDAVCNARPDGLVGDITVLLNAEAGPRFFQSGYALTTGSFRNQCSEFFRRGRMIVKTEHSPVTPGTVHRIAVEVAGGHMRYWFDDRILLEAWDPEPLEPDGNLWIGLRTWGTRLGLDNLVIYTGETGQPAPRVNRELRNSGKET